jgi:2-keto-4-pentenoate hydratase
MPMNDAEVAALANALIAAREPGAKPADVPKVVPSTDADAYRVQDLVIKALGPVTGWKVGAANPTSEPNCAPVLAGGISDSSNKPITVPARTGIEVEIAFRMAKAFPAAATAPSAADIFAGIGSAHVAMELCASRIVTGQQSPGHCNLADNGMNLGFVMGPKIENWRAIIAATQVAHALVDGKIVVNTTGGHTQQDLGKLLVWLVGHVVTKRDGLAAGAVVATGSWTGLHWTTPPNKSGGEFPGVGRMEIALVTA